MKRLCYAVMMLLFAGVAHAGAPGVINQYNALCDPNFPTRCAAPDASGNLPVTGTFSATLGGFAPNGNYATLSASSVSSRVALPTGAVVVVQNTGTKTAYVNLGDGTVTATTSQIAIPAQSWVSLTVGANVDLAGITGAGDTTTLTLVGGAGLATGAGGGGSSGSSSGASAADEATWTAGVSTFAPFGGFYQTTPTANALTTGHQGFAQMTANRALMVNLRDSSANELGVAAAPLQVSLANTAANATAVKVDGSAVTQPVSAASLPLPTGAATAAKQPAIGTAGTASSDVLTVQGIAAMTPLLVNGSGSTQPVSGTVTANQGTSPWVSNVTQFGSSNVATGTGASGAGIPRVTVSNDSYLADTTATGSITTTQNVAITTSGQTSVGIAITGSFTGTLVFEATVDGTNWVPTSAVQIANGTISSSTAGLFSGQANVGGLAGFRVRGNTVSVGTASVTLRAGVGPATVMADNPFPVTQSTSPWVVSNGGTFAVQAAQSGTWTVQPGNTANTTPWLTTINQGGNSATVSAAGALKVDGSAVTQPVSGTFWQTTQPVSISGNQAVNLAQVAGASTATGHGTASGALRVELPTDGTGVVNSNPMGLQLANAGSAAINVSTATTTQLVALSSGKAIYVTSFDVIAGGTGNITFEYGTGASCGTGTTALTGAYNLTAQAGISKGSGNGPVLIVPASNALCVLTSAAVQMSGSVSYVQQ